MYPAAQIYLDTVSIVKAAVGSACEHNYLLNVNSPDWVKGFTLAVYDALSEINKKSEAEPKTENE